jgi:hypothetical protein
MDRYLKWEQLTLIQQLNCVCNMLVKKSITTAIIQGYHNRQSQILSNEDVALIMWGYKITGNILSPLQFHASKEVARKYLANCKKDKWSNERFNAVDWEHLELSLKIKADMYRIWQSKQNLGFCGTRVWVGYYLVICSPTSDAQIAEDARLQHTLCSARMTTALDYWSKMYMN